MSRSILKSSSGRRARRGRCRPGLEWLEIRQVPTTFVVNTPLDTVAADLNTGKDATGHISLRSAIMAANAHAGADSISLPVGVYKLTLPGANEDGGASGDLDIKGDLTINGSGNSVIDGNSLDRVFEILSGNVRISGVTITRGSASAGGGVLNVAGKVTLSNDTISGNLASGTTGIEGDEGTSESPTGKPGGPGSNAFGGGVDNAGGSLTISNSLITSNQVDGGEGGAGGDGLKFTGSQGSPSQTLGGDAASGNGGAGGVGGSALGGGVFNAANAHLTLSGVTFSSNGVISGPGGEGGRGGTAVGGKGGDVSSPNEMGGDGGDAFGGVGGPGGDGGLAEGGGLFNAATTVGGGTVAFSEDQAIFSGNLAFGGAGGAGGSGGLAIGGNAGGFPTGRDENVFVIGGFGGDGIAGAGGNGGVGGRAEGGAIANEAGATFSFSSIGVSDNLALGGTGGVSGAGGIAGGGIGGRGGQAGTGGLADANDFTAVFGGQGGSGLGGGVYTGAGGKFILSAPNSNTTAPPASGFGRNNAVGGQGGSGSAGAEALGGLAGDGPAGALAGNGGGASRGLGGHGGNGGLGAGGAFYNAGATSLTGITVGFGSNAANGGGAGSGGNGGDSFAADASQDPNLVVKTGGGIGGDSVGGPGGNGGQGGIGEGGAIFNAPAASLVLLPRHGAPAGSAQAAATDGISSNLAFSGLAGFAGSGTLPHPGAPSPKGGKFGMGSVGHAGQAGSVGSGVGGGLYLDPAGTATFSNVTISGNQAATSDEDVHGTFKMV